MVEKYIVPLSGILTIVFEVIAMILGNHGNTSGEITSFVLMLCSFLIFAIALYRVETKEGVNHDD